MTVALDLLQFFSTSAAVVALVVLILQTRDGSQQTMAMRAELAIRQSTWLAQSYVDHRTQFFQHDSALLAWYLSGRGYRSTTPFEDRQRLYALTTLDIHEGIHIQHANGTVTNEVYAAWRQILTTDLGMPIYADVWENGAKFYEASFARYVSDRLAALAHTTPQDPRPPASQRIVPEGA